VLDICQAFVDEDLAAVFEIFVQSSQELLPLSPSSVIAGPAGIGCQICFGQNNPTRPKGARFLFTFSET
jgi:hypothetical protein